MEQFEMIILESLYNKGINKNNEFPIQVLNTILLNYGKSETENNQAIQNLVDNGYLKIDETKHRVTMLKQLY